MPAITVCLVASICAISIWLIKASLFYLFRPCPITYVNCMMLTGITLAAGMAGSLPLVILSSAGGIRDMLQRAVCMMVIAGSEIVAALLLFGCVTLCATLLIWGLAWRRHLKHAVCTILGTDLLTNLVLLTTVIFLVSPPPYLVLWQTPTEHARRALVCYPPRPSTLVSIVRQAQAYLVRQYDPQVGLLRESPTTAPHRYWLATDNLIALLALRSTDNYTVTNNIAATIGSYGDPVHGLIEALDGRSIVWPPYVATQKHIATIGSAEIWLETRTSGAQYQDWAAYADLILYAALHAHNQGQSAEAHHLYRAAMQMFDGVGFADQAFRADGVYATYKLALALFVATVLNETPDPRLSSALLTQQATTSAYAGGFYALYDRQGHPLNDPNTETTAYALLALSCFLTEH